MFRKMFDKEISNPETSSLINLSAPSKDAIAKREQKIKKALKKLGNKYMNVPFKGEPETAPVNEIEQARRKKTA